MSSFDNALLEALAERRTVDASSLGQALPPSNYALDHLVELAARLPTGLIYADAIYVLPSAPDGLLPLAPDSAWYATERTLMVALSPDGDALESILVDIGRYFQAARHIHDRLDSSTIEALTAGDSDPLATTKLAMALDVAPDRIGRLENDAPGLAADMAQMGRARFDPEVHVHVDLLPSEQNARGRAIAKTLLARVPPGTFMLAVSDRTAAVELLSPYTRDLGHALYAWSLENAERVQTPGLVEAVRQGPGVPQDDLSALIVPDLFRQAPQLLEERRAQEASQGLWLDDALGTAHGFAHLEQLAAPDTRLFEQPRTGTIVVLAGGAPGVLHEAARVLLESARVSGFVGIFGANLDGDRSVIADALVSSADGVRLGTASELVELAEKNEIRAIHAGAIPVGARHGAPIIAMNVLQTIRRTRVLGTLEADTPVYLVLHPASGGGLTRASSGLEAARLGLLALFSPPSQKGTKRRKPPKSEGSGRLTRRFRA